MARSRAPKRSAQKRRVDAFTLGEYDYFSVFVTRVEEDQIDGFTYHQDFASAKALLVDLIDREVGWLLRRRTEIERMPADDCLRVDAETLALVPARGGAS